MSVTKKLYRLVSCLAAMLAIIVCVTHATPEPGPGAKLLPAAANFASLTPDSTHLDFSKDILPLVSKCQPCHFAGGKMYAQLPFDKPQTIRKLGAQLFTRIKDEKEQALIRRFLAQTDSTSQTTLQETRHAAQN